VAGIRPILNLISLAFPRWALREIDPMHPDVPRLVIRANELERPV
jgi:hypothetical protein